jgi:hypothetical protein
MARSRKNSKRPDPRKDGTGPEKQVGAGAPLGMGIEIVDGGCVPGPRELICPGCTPSAAYA